VELFHADGGKDRHHKVAFRNFAKAPKMKAQILILLKGTKIILTDL
jgi:hypothetical protein